MNKVIAALDKLYNELPDSFNVFNDIHHSFITENTTRSGKDVLWYLDENYNIAIYIDTLEFLSEEEIDNQLC